MGIIFIVNLLTNVNHAICRAITSDQVGVAT